METVTLRDLIIAAKEGKKFRTTAYLDGSRGPSLSHDFNGFKNDYFQFTINEILSDWQVEWIKEPLKWEGEVTPKPQSSCGEVEIYLTFPQEFKDKKFKITMIEVTDGKEWK